MLYFRTSNARSRRRWRPLRPSRDRLQRRETPAGDSDRAVREFLGAGLAHVLVTAAGTNGTSGRSSRHRSGAERGLAGFRRAGGGQPHARPGGHQLARGTRCQRPDPGQLSRRLRLQCRGAGDRSHLGPGGAGHHASQGPAGDDCDRAAPAGRGADHCRLRPRLVSGHLGTLHRVSLARREQSQRDRRVGRGRPAGRFRRPDIQRPG